MARGKTLSVVFKANHQHQLIGTNNQNIASYSLHQATTETNTLIAHLNQYIRSFKQKPNAFTADAGYGSKKNQWLEDKRITVYVKHNRFGGKKLASGK